MAASRSDLSFPNARHSSSPNVAVFRGLVDHSFARGRIDAFYKTLFFWDGLEMTVPKFSGTNAFRGVKSVDGMECVSRLRGLLFQSSSMVEHAAVNRVVEGSSPSSGAIRRGLRCRFGLAHGRPF